MIATVVLAGVADGITVVVDPAELEKLRALMRPSRKQHTWQGVTADGSTVTLAADMICAIVVRAVGPHEVRKR